MAFSRRFCKSTSVSSKSSRSESASGEGVAALRGGCRLVSEVCGFMGKGNQRKSKRDAGTYA